MYIYLDQMLGYQWWHQSLTTVYDREIAISASNFRLNGKWDGYVIACVVSVSAQVRRDSHSYLISLNNSIRNA